MKNDQPPASSAAPSELLVPGAAPALEVNISADLASVDVMHHERTCEIMEKYLKTPREGDPRYYLKSHGEAENVSKESHACGHPAQPASVPKFFSGGKRLNWLRGSLL